MGTRGFAWKFYFRWGFSTHSIRVKVSCAALFGFFGSWRCHRSNSVRVVACSRPNIFPSNPFALFGTNLFDVSLYQRLTIRGLALYRGRCFLAVLNDRTFRLICVGLRPQIGEVRIRGHSDQILVNFEFFALFGGEPGELARDNSGALLSGSGFGGGFSGSSFVFPPYEMFSRFPVGLPKGCCRSCLSCLRSPAALPF